MTSLDYETVSRYWSTADASILGTYMMDGFGFPVEAGRFRFRAECKIINRLIHEANRDGCLLDLGSGIGFWTEFFAERLSRVVAVDASEPLFEAMKERCAPNRNVTAIRGDVLHFQPEDLYDLVFLGGLLMYLNDKDLICLLEKLIPALRSGGLILRHETTVRMGSTTRQADYQAVYRSVADYERIFAECELSVRDLKVNTPYVLMQMGCKFVKKWKACIPAPLHCLPAVGRLAYWGLRLGHPGITRVPESLGLAYPKLTNHFFVLELGSQPTFIPGARTQVS